jgi:hypothetical protein
VRRIAQALVIMVLSSLALLIFAPSASAAGTCHETRSVAVSGARTVTTSLKVCTKDRDGYSRTQSRKVCTKSRAGSACTEDKIIDTHSVSAKGNVTDKHTVKHCVKSAGGSSVCTSDEATA